MGWLSLSPSAWVVCFETSARLESKKRNLVLRPWNSLSLVCFFTPSAEAPEGMSETLGFSVKDMPVWGQNHSVSAWPSCSNTGILG